MIMLSNISEGCVGRNYTLAFLRTLLLIDSITITFLSMMIGPYY